MRLTFVTDMGQTFVIEIDPQMELENIMALLEVESGIPVSEQSISFEGRDLSNPKSTMIECGVGINGNEAVLLLRRKVMVAGRQTEQDSEMMRLQILGDPHLMQQLRETQPEIAAAAQNDPTRFAELLRQTRARQLDAGLAQQREIERLNADPFDVEAQRRIEEAIRQQAVLENMEHAMEYSPESFGRVTMLYIPVEVNSTPVKAFVDSGAQQTIMSPECAEKCGSVKFLNKRCYYTCAKVKDGSIMRLLDRRFAGVARGVGTARILGRVHSAQLKLADLHLACSFTIMEGRDVDLLLGLDMLKAHQACIDLQKNVLRIQDREVKFLAEHELPDKARFPEDLRESGTQPQAGPSTGPQNNQQFPGDGNRLGQPPVPPAQGSVTTSRSLYPENNIKTLMDLGATRDSAIKALDSAKGNVEYAASILFSSDF